MNRDIAKGAIRNVRGRATTAVGSVTGDLSRQADGLVDQVAGGTRYLYGKASDRIEALREVGSERLDDIYSDGRASARAVVHYAERRPVWTVAGIAALAFVLGWHLRPAPPRRRR